MPSTLYTITSTADTAIVLTNPSQIIVQNKCQSPARVEFGASTTTTASVVLPEDKDTIVVDGSTLTAMAVNFPSGDGRISVTTI